MVLHVEESQPLYESVASYVSRCWGVPSGRFPGCQPVSIERRHFSQLRAHPYVVCEKTDGDRCMLVALRVNGRNVCVFVDRSMRVRQITINLGRRAYEGTILEGELYANTLLLYDALVVDGVPIGQCGFLDRYDALERFVKACISMKSDEYRIVLKTFFVLEEFDVFMHRHLPTVKQEIDGVIFTPVNEPVRTGTHETMFKWKPKGKNTVDFRMERDGQAWRLYVQERGKPVYESTIPPGRIAEEPDWFEDGAIVECEYVTDEIPMWWRPLKRRLDKQHPNNRRTYYRTIVNIKEDIKMDEFANLLKV